MIYVQDSDFTLHVGDVRDVLRDLPAESVDCVVTSPPYWGLRDYGTGEWDGGDAKCDHRPRPEDLARAATNASKLQGGKTTQAFAEESRRARNECKCGATRIDRQLGLEPTPEEYVANMVEVFREVRRVLARHGTCWVNLGDSYNANQGAGFNGQKRQDHANRHTVMARPDWLKPKDLVGIPWRIAFALQADGWYLRSDIIWAKPNPMPESVTDRPTKAHEYVFLLTKSPRYFFDQEAVREPSDPAYVAHRERYNGLVPIAPKKAHNGDRNDADRNPQGGFPPPSAAGRNIRSVWEIATQPYPEAHFATYPEALVERCLKAGCAEGGTVLDPFLGSGTTALVARRLGRLCVGIELNQTYAGLAAKRLSQLSLLAEGAACRPPQGRR